MYYPTLNYRGDGFGYLKTLLLNQFSVRSMVGQYKIGTPLKVSYTHSVCYMGIQDLVSTLRKKTPEAFSIIPLGVAQPRFEGKVIAVDGTLYITRFSRVFGDRDWVGPMLSLLANLKSMGLRPIVVLDTSEGRPAEKANVADKKRDQARKTSTEKARILKDAIYILNTTDPTRVLSPENRVTLQSAWGYMLRSRKYGPSLVEQHFIDAETRLAVANRRMPPPDFPSVVHLKRLIPVLQALYASVDNQLAVVRKGIIVDFANVLMGLGVPVVHARSSEGEALCVSLQTHACCDFVLSDDSDILPHGAKYAWRLLPDNNIEQIELSKVLNGLEMTHTQFVDFCILCGTDYNSRIKGVGPAKALKLIEKHGDLDKVNAHMKTTGHHIDDLNYQRVREIFSAGQSEETLQTVERDLKVCNPCETTQDVEKVIKGFIRKYGIQIPHNELVRSFGVLAPHRKINLINGPQFLPIDTDFE